MARILTQNINFPVVLRVQGWLLMIEAIFMLFPMFVSLASDEQDVAAIFGYSAAITAASGAAMTFGLRRWHRNTSMRKRDGLLLTAIVWLFFSLFGMIPMLWTGTLHSPADAFFETMSGFTTTGASVIPNVENVSRGVLFWRALMQWIGGMGIILFTLAVLPMLNYKGGISLFNAEVTGITHERMRPRVSQTAKSLWLIYMALSLLMAVLLARPMGWFDAVCHAMTTMSTGGFSTRNIGIEYWHSSYVDLVVTIFMFIGGINFTLIYSAITGQFDRVRRNDTFRWYCAIVLTVSAIIFIRMTYQGFLSSTGERLNYAIFDTVAAATSTGFSTKKYESVGQFIALLLMIVMFFGGMAGSTSGGAKIDRLIVLFKNTRNEFYRVLHSNSVTSVRVGGKAVPHQVVSKSLAFLAIYMMVIFAGGILLTIMEVPMFDALFTSMSAVSNVGMGYGVTGAMGSYALLPDAAKWLLAFEMMVGRLELFTVLILFTPSFWLKD